MAHQSHIPSGTRRLLVYPKTAPRGKGYIILPEIRLHGRWLESAGFSSHQPIRVTYEQGRIIITPDEEPRTLPVAAAIRPELEQWLDAMPADLPHTILRDLPSLHAKHKKNK